MLQRVVIMVHLLVQTMLSAHGKRHGIARPARNSHRCGRVDQLADRPDGIRQVAGSTPVASTNPPLNPRASLPIKCTGMASCQCPQCKHRDAAPALGLAIEALIKAKASANLRPSYIRSLRQYLDQFGRWRCVETNLADITVDDLDAWFAERDEAPSSRASNIGRLSSLFSFAVRRRWIPHNPCDALERPRLDARTPRILTPEEARLMLETCRARWPRFVPALALMLFVGVRPFEVQRLSWSAIDLDAATIRIDGAASKVRGRRIARIPPNACAWLRIGGDIPCRSHRRHVRRIASVLGWWEQDCLRHAAASYALHTEQDAGKVATALGNSVSILLRHYAGLVSPAAARDFWSILP